MTDFENFPSGGNRITIRDEDGQEIHGFFDGIYFPTDEGDKADPRIWIRIPYGTIAEYEWGSEWSDVTSKPITTPDAPPAEWSPKRRWWRRRGGA